MNDPRMMASIAAAGGGGAMPTSGGGDIANQLMQLLEPVLASPKGQAMLAAVMEQVGGPAGIAQLMGGMGAGRGPTTDGELYDAQDANQSVRGNLPVMPDTGGYTGYGAEMDSMPDPRQTPFPPGMNEEMLLRMIQEKMGMGEPVPGQMKKGAPPAEDEDGDDDGDHEYR